MCTSVLVISLLFFGAVIGNDDSNRAKLRFYTKSMDNYTEMYIDEAHKMFSTSWYDPKKTFNMFAHGFTGHPNGPAVNATISAWLKQDESNVALLNWEKLAAMALPGVLNSYMHWAIPNAIQLGDDLSETLLKASAYGMDLNNTHFVGHSLGAHLFGVTGNKLMAKGVAMPRITGLDPATGFETKPSHLRLNPKSSLCTSVVHSDWNKYGSKRELGLVNFWPNFRGGSVIQPGCPGGNSQRFSDEDFCSHNRSWQLFIDAMQNPGTIYGSYAKNFRTWKKYTKEQSEENVLELGVCDINALPGNYYFKTAGKAPYGLGLEGLYHG